MHLRSIIVWKIKRKIKNETSLITAVGLKIGSTEDFYDNLDNFKNNWILL